MAPLDTPLARGVTAMAVAGGALTLVGAAVPAVDAVDQAEDAPTVLRVSSPSALQPGQVLAPSSLDTVPPEPSVADADALVRAVERAAEARAEADRRAEEARAAAEAERLAAEEAAREAEQAARAAEERAASLGCGLNLSSLGAVQAHVEDAAQFLGCQFGQPTMLGVGSRSGASDHPSGLALDLMTRGATGDAIAACALENMDALGITYVIWEQAINHGDGWQPMEDRGGDTANHMDHVHISFTSGGGSGNPVAC